MANRVSNAQLEELLNFLNEHPALAKGVGLGARSKETVDILWNDLAKKLNSCGSGSVKSGERWKKYWADIKHKSKCRLAKRRRDAVNTGSSSILDHLSDVDTKILALVGEPAVVDVEHKVPLFNSRPDIKAPSVIVSFEHDGSDDPLTRVKLENVESESMTVGEDCEISSNLTDNESDIVNCPSTSGHTNLQKVEIPLSRTHIEGPPRRRKRLSQSNISNPSWLNPELMIELERKRVEAEAKLADAALIMAEASRIQAEVARSQADTMRTLVQMHSEDIHAVLQLAQARQQAPSNPVRIDSNVE